MIEVKPRYNKGDTVLFPAEYIAGHHYVRRRYDWGVVKQVKGRKGGRKPYYIVLFKEALYQVSHDDIIACKVKAAKNPPTANQVYFQTGGKTLVGWIHSSTPTRYKVAYDIKDGRPQRFAWRKKSEVAFVQDGRRRRNPCPWTRRNPRAAVEKAARLSERFYGMPARYQRRANINWPKALTLVGDCARLDYVSDKLDGKTRRWSHKFKSALVYAAPDPQPGGFNMLIVLGRFKINERGIVG